MMQLFATTTNAQPANAQANLRTCIFQTGERQIHTYLMLNQTVGQTSWITLIHCPNQYVSPMGTNEPSRHLGLLGDVRHGTLPQLVVWPDRDFRQTNAVNVPDSLQIDTILAADANLEQIGPFADNAAGTTTITTLKLMYLPPKYIPRS